MAGAEALVCLQLSSLWTSFDGSAVKQSALIAHKQAYPLGDEDGQAQSGWGTAGSNCLAAKLNSSFAHK